MECGCALGNRIGVIIDIVIVYCDRYILRTFPDAIINLCDDDIDRAAIFNVSIRAIAAQTIAIANSVINTEGGCAAKSQGNINEGAGISVCVSDIVVVIWNKFIGCDCESCRAAIFDSIDGCTREPDGELGARPSVFSDVVFSIVSIVPFAIAAPHCQGIRRSVITVPTTILPIVVIAWHRCIIFPKPNACLRPCFP